VLVVGLLTWLLWPTGPDVMANAPAENAAETPAIAEAGGTASSVTPPAAVPDATASTMAIHAAAPSAVVATAPSAATELVGDLQAIQGTWQVSEVAVPSELPQDRASVMIAQIKLLTWTIKGDVLTMTTPQVSLMSTIKLDPTQTPKAIDLIPLDGQRALTMGLYSIEGDTWRLCMVENSKVRPQEMKSDQAMVLTFRRGSATDAAPASVFDIKQWQAAEAKLKAMQVRAEINSVMGEPGYPAGVTHVVGISPPETADGTLSPELWAITNSLSHVTIRTVSTTDATLRQLSQHPGLVGLNLSGRFSVTPAGIAHLKSCFHLRGLYFSEVPVTAELLTVVSQLDQLRNFGIYKSPMTSEMLGSVVQLNQLESLSLQETGLTDADAAQIAKLTKLKSLILNGSKLTDAGLKTLQSLEELTYLDVRGIAVTPQAVAEFEAALPKCKVQK
jgi:uncharacterized protein (TIGR03067 family)